MSKLISVKPIEVYIQQGVLDKLNETFNGNKELLIDNERIVFEQVIYLLYLLNSISLRFKDENYELRLYSTIIKESFKSRYKPYFNFLIDKGLIKLLRNHSDRNGTSRVYCFTSTYKDLNKDLYLFKITGRPFLQSLNYKESFLSEYQYKRNKQCRKQRKHLVRSFDKDLTIDKDAAVSVIKSFGRRKFIANYHTIFEFDKKLWKYSIKEETDNRLHSNLTRLNKKLLKHITYNGTKLAEIDIRTSQPLFLYSILNSLISKKNQETKLSLFLEDKISQELKDKISTYDLDLIKLKQFGDILIKKDFYSHLADRITVKKTSCGKKVFRTGYRTKKGESNSTFFREEKNTPRDLFKGIVMEVLYSGSNNSNNEIKLVKEEFKSVFGLVDLIKDFHKNESNFLSSLLQNVEAYILLDVIAKEFSKKHTKLPLFSKHDSLITTIDNINILKNFSEPLLNKYLGLEDITINIDYW